SPAHEAQDILRSFTVHVRSDVFCENGRAEFHSFWLSAHEVDPVWIVIFVTDIFEHVRVGSVVPADRQSQGLRQRPGICGSDLILNVSEIKATELLGDAEFFRVRVPCSIEPGPVIETY